MRNLSGWNRVLVNVGIWMMAAGFWWSAAGAAPPPIAAADAHVALAWKHGWKTERVVATRYSNPAMGYNIGFTFPRDPGKCDRAEIVAFIEARGGNIYEMGGYPGAEMFATFDDVKDRATADRKLKAMLPHMSRLVASLR